MKNETITKGLFLSFNIKGRKSDVSGIVLNYSEDWILIKRCDDYTVDGFTVIKRKIATVIANEITQRAQKILSLKKYDYTTEPEMPLSSLQDIVQFIDLHYNIIQIDSKDGEALDLLKFRNLENKIYYMEGLLPSALWGQTLAFKTKEFRVISFDSNYSNSLCMIADFSYKTD
jgi:hypothetical protein